MAGAGYKLFTTGQVLTAAEVNTYLQEQTVMVFNDAASRTTALSGVLAEGMVSYLKSTKVVEIYNGTAWASLDDPNAIQNTIVDAKGDLIAATGNDVPARLAVGNNGETLVADSSASTGLRWQASMSAGKNCIINGGMDIWQRGTSFTVASATKTFASDRWMPYRGATGLTASRQSSGLAGFTYSLRMQRDSGNTSTTTIFLGQNVEILNSAPYIDKIVTLSFWARAGANYSAASSALGYQLTTGTNASDQDGFLNGYTGSATPIGQTAFLTTSWQRFSASGTLSSTATQFYVAFNTIPTGTAGANDWFEVTGVQVELGSAATAFSRAGGNIAGELAAAMRYCEKLVIKQNSVMTVAQAYSTSAAWGGIQWTVQKRTAPTITQTGTLQALQSNTATSGTTFAYSDISENNSRVNHSSGTGLVAGNACIYQATGGDVSLLISAEL